MSVEQHNPHRPARSVAGKYALGALGAVLLLVGFFAGVVVSDLQASRSSSGTTKGKTIIIGTGKPTDVAQGISFDGFWDVWEMVRTRHVNQPVDETKMFYGSLAGIVGSLGDPYSIFLDPEAAEQFQTELSGTFDGVGMEIGVKQNQLKVIAPLPGTPAEKAGLKAGDSIMAIDGADTYGMAVDEAVRRIRGPKGTEVKLNIVRDGEDMKEFKIMRAAIVVESVRRRIVDKGERRFGVIEIRQFNEMTSPAFKEAVQVFTLEDLDGLIVDLRNNPGGYLDTAVEVSGEWISHDVVVQEKLSDGSMRNYVSDGNARLTEMPTVVLVNGGSASASEIVAGALQFHKKATIVGEKTFGKGSVQDLVSFEDGSALKLTIALWLTPGGVSIDKEGITPDVTVELTEEDFEAEKDPQFDRAIEILSGGSATDAGAGQKK